MEKNLIIAIAVFLIITFVVWKLTNARFIKEYGKKKEKLWGPRTYYWESIIGISTGCTFLVLFLLKWGNVLTF